MIFESVFLSLRFLRNLISPCCLWASSTNGNWGEEGKSPIHIHAPPTSRIIPLAAFDTGTSSGVVLRMEADGVSFFELTKLLRTGGLHPRVPPRDTTIPGALDGALVERRHMARGENAARCLRRKQAGNRQSLPDRSGTGVMNGAATPHELSQWFNSSEERPEPCEGPKGKKSPAGCVALPHIIYTEGRSTHPAFPEVSSRARPATGRGDGEVRLRLAVIPGPRQRSPESRGSEMECYLHRPITMMRTITKFPSLDSGLRFAPFPE